MTQKKTILFIQGTDVDEKSNQFKKIFDELTKRNYNTVYIPNLYKLPQTKEDFQKIDDFKLEIINYLHYSVESNEKIILIGHSFGGIILNSILNDYEFQNIEKVITIATFHKLKTKLSQRILNLNPFKTKKTKLDNSTQKLILRRKLRKRIGYKDISKNKLYKNNCYTIGFTLDPIVPVDSTKMENSFHKEIMAEHGFLFRKSTKIINEILNFCKL